MHLLQVSMHLPIDRQKSGCNELITCSHLEALTLPVTVTLPVTCHNYSVQSHCFPVVTVHS